MGPPTSGSDTRSELPTDPRGRWLAGRSNLRGDADFLKTNCAPSRYDARDRLRSGGSTMSTDSSIANGDPATPCWTVVHVVQMLQAACPNTWQRVLRNRLGSGDPANLTA